MWKKSEKGRIPIYEKDLRNLAEVHGGCTVSAIAKRAGLPYMDVYNVVHGRTKTISPRHYRMLFGEPPPHRQPEKMNGRKFRRLARLWLFLNDNLTASDLYREYYGIKHTRKTDYRLFSGKTIMVDVGLTSFMEQKFADNGIYGQQLDEWLDELDALPRNNRVRYDRIKPILQYLQDHLSIHPTTVLNQTVTRYETGDLKSVSRETYTRALSFKHKAERVISTRDDKAIVKLRESITGGKAGYILYLDIREELHFLHVHGKKSYRQYLGRSVWTYEAGRTKRIANWRAHKIRADCGQFIHAHPDIPLSVLPPFWGRWWAYRLVGILLSRLTQRLSEQDGMAFEKRILSPVYSRTEYTRQAHGFTRFDMAPRILGMRPKAFDLMVARHCDIFRIVGTYDNRWYLSDLYLKELSKKAYFNLISAKYELLARQPRHPGEGKACMH